MKGVSRCTAAVCLWQPQGCASLRLQLLVQGRFGPSETQRATKKTLSTFVTVREGGPQDLLKVNSNFTSVLTAFRMKTGAVVLHSCHLLI